MFSFFSTIRFRLTLWYSLLLGFFLFLLSGVVYVGISHNLSNRVTNLLNDTVVVEVQTTDQSGHLQNVYLQMPRESWELRVRQHFGCPPNLIDEDDARCRILKHPKVLQKLLSNVQTTNTLKLDIDENVVPATLGYLQKFFVVVIPFILILSFLGGYFLAGRVLRPIDAMTRTARLIEMGNLKQRIQLQGPSDELKNLADTFDSMLERIDHSFERQKQFTSDASHELQTPLAVVLTTSDVMTQDARMTRAEVEENLGVIKQAAKNMSHIIDDLMSLSRAEADAQILDVKPVHVKAMILSLISVLKTLSKPGVEILCEGPEITIDADPDKMKTIVSNLLTNALKYTEEGQIHIRLTQESQWVMLEFQDTGIGISKKDLTHIFDRFYRADRARNKGTGGTGLGLAIVKALVVAHQGTIAVQSDVGQGSVFTVRLPRRGVQLNALT